MKKNQKVLSVAVTLFLISVFGFLGFIGYNFVNQPAQQNASDQVVIYEVLPQTSFLKIAEDLERKGLIKSKTLFNAYARITGQRAKIKAGEYGFKASMKPSEVMQVLTSGKSIARLFTVSEGLNVFEIASLYENAGFGTAEQFTKLVFDQQFVKKLLGFDAKSLEGYLYPETYQITKFTSTKDLITAMVRRFFIVFEETQKQTVVTNLTPQQVVTLASIIEKETGAAQERTMISAVFHNRMAIKMKLQTDPTIIYGKALKTGNTEINITRADLSEPTPYNTYVIPGLPPGPISNPGREALIAAVRPAPVKYLYFVSHNDGTHAFSETYAQHEAAVKQFQLNRKAREGKSWRDLKNTKSTEGTVSGEPAHGAGTATKIKN